MGNKLLHILNILFFFYCEVVIGNVNIENNKITNVFHRCEKSEENIQIQKDRSQLTNFYFNGIDSRIKLNCGSVISKPFTFCAWIKPEDIHKNDMAIMGIPDVFWLFASTNREIRFAELSIGNIYTSGVLLSNNVWSFMCFVVDYKSVKIYCNSDYIGEFQFVNDYDFGNSLIIGKDNYQSAFHGNMREISVYDGKLDTEVIKDLYAESSRQQPLTEGLVIYYPYDDDKFFQAYKGSGLKINNVIFKPDSIHGTVGYFSGKESFIDFGLIPIDNVVSVSLWIKPQLLSQKKGALISLRQAISFSLTAEGRLVLTIPTIVDLKENSVQLKMNSWHHVGITFKEGKGVTFYLNGEKIGDSPIEEYKDATKELRIGTNIWSEFFIGEMDDLIIWNRVLSDEEIRHVFKKDNEYWQNELKPKRIQQFQYKVFVLPILSLLFLLFLFLKIRSKKRKLVYGSVEQMDPFLIKLNEIVEEKFADPNFMVDGFSLLMGMSKTKLYNELKLRTGRSPKEYIRECRLLKASEMLRESDMPVNEISEAVGFISRAYFNKCFREKFGKTPTEFRLN
ncbi:LamG-like jellyroll fold domain-containing protein [Carboxylicivirga marina]|uniref:Helix-turn-helix domain-containing protein n=1 Tax=Carboxylicivirga marina TaxID=2800988 RepID=A0ABS1HKY2_9BACT|nr:LamG-like jellyroll fold domain-containing protein [Carboxylicivirga marina]MBK3518270.1 helix-turn-helix domain-containing protein [Carboxylicivirga marina]